MKSLESLYPKLLIALSVVALVAGGCSKSEPTPTKEQLLISANDAFAADEFGKAEKQYREVLRLDQQNIVALRGLGIIYDEQGQVPQAYPLLKKTSELHPDPEVQVKLGLIYLASHDYQQARELALQILENQPVHEPALLLLADASIAADDVTASRKLIDRLRSQDRDRAGYHLALGTLDLREKDQARAERELKTAIELDARSSEAYMRLGVLYWSRKELDAASQAFKTAADLAPLRSLIRVRYADFLFSTGATEQAKDTVEEITRKKPEYLPPRVLLMKMACTKHRDDDCAVHIRNVLAQDPANYDAVFYDGILSIAKGDAAKAIRNFEYLSNALRQNAQVRLQLAVAYSLSAKGADSLNTRRATEKAESSLKEAIDLDPSLDPAVVLFAELKFRKNSSAAAIDPLVELIKRRPEISKAHYLLASAYLAQRNEDQALAVYRKMTELFPQDPQPSFLTGMILQQRRHPDARAAFEKSVMISPGFLPALEGLVNLDIAENQHAAALERTQREIDKDPNHAQLLALRARIYLAQPDLTRAEADLLKAIELAPQLEIAYTMLASLYATSNRQDEAIARLNAFVKEKKTVPTLMLLALIQDQVKNFTASRDAYEALLSIAANHAPALNNLAVYYSERGGQIDKAYDLAKKAREVAPNDPSVADTLGWILFKRGEYGAALALLRESAGTIPNNPEVQFHLGMAHYMLGDEGLAEAALRNAVDGKADFSDKDEARQRLAVLALNVETADITARTNLENYLRERPNDPVALTRLAGLQERDGAPDQAVKTYQKVVADHPLFGPAVRRLVLLYGPRTSEVANAHQLALKARQVYPDDPDVAKALGILSYRRDYHPQAIELLREASTKGKGQDDPELLYYLGAAHYQLKQWNECKASLERSLALNPTAGRDDARQLLKECADASPQ